eukprot:3022125-Pleurochrysis_carterae.AAC.3
MRFALSALQAAAQLVGVVQLQEDGAVGEARAIVWGPAEADGKLVTKFGKFEKVFARLEAVLEVGQQHHEFATPGGLNSKNVDADEVKVGQLEGEKRGELVLVKGEGLEVVVGGRTSICLNDKELASIRR